jgi:hypothetical protein
MQSFHLKFRPHLSVITTLHPSQVTSKSPKYFTDGLPKTML